MKVKDFIEKLKHIASLPTTYYSVSGGDWAKWNGKSWNFDCVILIKAILWGWNENKNHAHGGAVYGSNGVYDDSADTIINRCKNVSSNFKKIETGELLYMAGHVGIYIGDGQVIECTAAWESKVVYSKIDSNGNRSRNGISAGRWLKHGKLPYLTYDESDTTSSTENKTETTLKHKEGETVKYNKIYSSSTSTEALTPVYTSGKITKVYEGTRNPYLIGDDTGFINDDCITSSSNSEPEARYKVGTNYTTQVILKVRTGAGTNYSQKTYNQLTTNGKQNAYSSGVNAGCLKKGTVVTCQEVKTVGKDTWIKIPSGWIAGYYSGQVYVK